MKILATDVDPCFAVRHTSNLEWGSITDFLYHLMQENLENRFLPKLKWFRSSKEKWSSFTFSCILLFLHADLRASCWLIRSGSGLLLICLQTMLNGVRTINVNDIKTPSNTEKIIDFFIQTFFNFQFSMIVAGSKIEASSVELGSRM